MRIHIQIRCLALNGGSQNSYNSVRIPKVATRRPVSKHFLNYHISLSCCM